MPFDAALLIRPCSDFIRGGDTGLIKQMDGGLFAALVDVKGRGEEAYSVSKLAYAFLQKNANLDMSLVLQRLQEDLRGIWGAAVAIDFFDQENIFFVGVGNISVKCVCEKFYC